MPLVCITNDIDDIRCCTQRGEHASNCDGQEWRYDRDTEISWPTANECRGCLPHEAEHGLLCWSCWEKLRDALKIAPDMITHLRSVERAQQIDNNGVRASVLWVIPVPNTWRMADELIMLAGHPAPGFPSDANVFEVDAITERYLDRIDPNEWVSRTDGAEAAVRFYLLMQQAMAQHPMADYTHRIRNVRCGECRQRTLLWKPPLAFDGDIRIECTNPECEFVAGDARYTELAWMEVTEARSEIRARQTKVKAEERKARALRRREIKAAERRAEKAAKAAAGGGAA